MDDYKLVSVNLNPDSDKSHAVQVYSLKSNSWKSLQPINTYVFDFNKSRLLFNGALHWLTKKVMVSFNISEERFEEMQLPMPLKSLLEMVGLLKGRPGVFGLNEKNNLELWAMQDHGVPESWTKLYSIRPFQTTSMNFIGSLRNGTSVLVLHMKLGIDKLAR
ncbi:putative F-box protein At3g49980 [Papaver somniferum]|uniref:putative F-box protein At3g49980 n=1 Tax=Papaver somniferum TaxID=3469 RepID=UPI000E6FD97F|nr:putative F-box protein At3g49980 [Papaver somniferum]